MIISLFEIRIYIYNWLIVCDIICRHVFSENHLILVSQLVCSSLGKTIPHSPTIPSLPVVLSVGFVALGNFPVPFGISTSVIFVQFEFWQSC